MYVGQAKQMRARGAQHRAAGRVDSIDDIRMTEMPDANKLAREIAEHKRIQELTGGIPARRSDLVSNKRDPIGPNRSKFLNEGN